MESSKNAAQAATTTEVHASIARAKIDQALRGYRPSFQRILLEQALQAIDPNVEALEDAEDRKILEALGCDENKPPVEPPDPSPRLRLDKAKDDVVPLVKWLLARDPAAKLAAILADALIGSDIERNVKNNRGYNGNIGHDLWHDWQQDVVRMIEDPDTRAEDRAVAAWIMGAISAT